MESEWRWNNWRFGFSSPHPVWFVGLPPGSVPLLAQLVTTPTTLISNVSNTPGLFTVWQLVIGISGPLVGGFPIGFGVIGGQRFPYGYNVLPDS